ncbi:hypothetical protein AA01_17885 [Salmonella enterica subsp. enterica serovar Pomona]|nr:hypothetical protein [Salmonella enterica subsp. enterica serovar Pomona]
MKVPKRKYYPLNEAAEILECSVNDLIFHGAHGNIELCAYLQTEMFLMYDFDLQEWKICETYNANKGEYEDVPHYPQIMTEPQCGQLIDDIAKVSAAFSYIFSSDILFISDEGHGLATPPSTNEGSTLHLGARSITIRGLMAVPQFTLKDYETALTNGNEVVCVFWDVPNAAIIDNEQRKPSDFTPTIAGWDFLISKRDLYITLSEMNKLTAGDEGESLTCRQAQFIYDLLAIHYGQDVADNPRRFIDDPDSEIAKDFHDKTKKLPSGRSVERWLKKLF